MLNKIKNKLQNKDAKVLISNFISLSSINLIGLIIPFFTLPYVIRVIGLGNYGLIALASALTAYFVTLVGASLKKILAAFETTKSNKADYTNEFYGDGFASKRIIDVMSSFYLKE